jgi:formylglycine-generating enzyme required for sulfatase activity
MDDGPAKLRALTDDYFSGLIERGHYLSERGALLDRLVGLPPVEVDDTDSATVPKISAMDESIAIPTPASAAPPGKEPPGNEPPGKESPGKEPPALESASAATSSVTTAPESAGRQADAGSVQPPEAAMRAASEETPPDRRVLLASAGAIIVAGLVGLFWFTGTDSDSADIDHSPPLVLKEDRRELLEQSLVAAEPEMASSLDRVEQFLTGPRWNETDVASFVFDWDMLSTAKRESLRQSDLFVAFTNEVRNRIKVDRALGSTAFENGMSLSEAVSVELDLGLVEEVAEIQSTIALNQDRPDSRTNLAGLIDAVAESENEVAVKSAIDPPPATVPSERMQVSTPAPDQPVESIDAKPETVELSQAAQVPERPVSDRPVSDRTCSVERLNFKSSTCWDMLTDEVKGPVLRVLPGGTFQMGQSNDKQAAPVHEQAVPVPFAIGTFEITVGQFEEYCAATGTPCPKRRWAGPDFPVVDVTWQQAVGYTYWLSEVTGSSYRLPTEVEWEYAARGGQSALYPFGDTISPTYARFDTGMKTLAPLPIVDRTTRYNGFRLWHVAGNVREWTADPWRENYNSDPDPQMRAVRGGSYADSADRLRSAARSGESVSYFDAKTGFRVARELDTN